MVFLPERYGQQGIRRLRPGDSCGNVLVFRSESQTRHHLDDGAFPAGAPVGRPQGAPLFVPRAAVYSLFRRFAGARPAAAVAAKPDRPVGRRARRRSELRADRL